MLRLRTIRFVNIMLIVEEVADALDIPLVDTPLHERLVFEGQETTEDDESNSSITGNKRRRSSRIQKLEDHHNEECEVCDGEGDLLCCDACSLVYHMGCVRPVLDKIPEGDWYCPYCLIDKMARITSVYKFIHVSNVIIILRSSCPLDTQTIPSHFLILLCTA